MRKIQKVVLSSRPDGVLKTDNFQLLEGNCPSIGEGQFLIKNSYLSLDAGFRQWMNEGASDNYLSAMPLGEAVQSIALGEVVESRHPDYPVGVHVVGRTAWETYSIADGSDLMTIVDVGNGVTEEHHLSVLGPSGMTAYFGLRDIGKVKAGDTVLVSAAAGGVGSLVGQMAKILGCRTIGISSSDKKCKWLTTDLQYDDVINYNSEPGLDKSIKALAPDGVDVYFDNVGGEMLDTVLPHLALKARVVLCGAISQYDDDSHAGVRNMWELITKRARAEGFMFSDYVDDYEDAATVISQWVAEGKLNAPVSLTHGISTTAAAFCDMLTGKNLGKSLVKLF
jgi:NADPH-dependent curcumin reductase